MTGWHCRPTDRGANRPDGRTRRRRRGLVAVAGAAVAGLVAWLGVNPAAHAADLVASFDWSVPERTVVNPNTGSVNVRVPTRSFISPNTWPVALNGCASSPGWLRFDITLSDRVATVEGPNVPGACEMTFEFPHQGYFPVTLTVTDDSGQQGSTNQTVQVRDFLIASMGDSSASGEGNPDQRDQWYDRRCHRSGWSGPAQTALRMEQKSPKFSVTFVSLACSGAGIYEGLIYGYKGQEGGEGKPLLTSQIEEMSNLLCAEGRTCNNKFEIRKIDALLVNVSANDMHFGDIVFACALPDLAPPCHSRRDVNARLARDLKDLPGKLNELATVMDAWLDYSTVYIPEYLDPTRNENHDFCMMQLGRLGNISSADAAWSYLKLIEPMNGEIAKAAARNGAAHRWQFVGGVVDRFATQGYCASNTMVVGYNQSFDRQNNKDGTMHPNEAGHRAYADAFMDALFR